MENISIIDNSKASLITQKQHRVCTSIQ